MTIPSETTELSNRQRPTNPEPREFPVREYIGAMAVELAQMARWDGDENLGRLLDAAAARAVEGAPTAALDLEQPARRRPA